MLPADIPPENPRTFVADLTLNCQIPAKPQKSLIGMIQQVSNRGGLILKIFSEFQLLLIGTDQLMLLFLKNIDLRLVSS
ncbi:hypothetical protein SDC9_207576 [bioreactor metagenome]|uniref:Uncharacterized protein n=1 Tax=bioreactor metagenome TaxID=1076179 RepID=A0A645JHN4_9ZZZZ